MGLPRRLVYREPTSKPGERLAGASAAVRIGELCDAIAPDGWLGHHTPDRFLHLGASPVPLEDGEAERFFARRGLTSRGSDCDARTLAQALVAVDLRAVAHSASFLLWDGSEDVSRELVRAAVGATPPDDPPRLDHVGLEVFGRLEWYIAALEAWARQGAVRLRGCRLFPSVQVRRALAWDPQLADVRIARVYLERGARAMNLELFEVTQDWRFTAARQIESLARPPRPVVAALSREIAGTARGPLVPVSHLALAVSRAATVEAVERGLAEPVCRAPAVRAYADGPCYNPADDSLNTKFRARSEDAGGAGRFGPILELICYGVGAGSRRGRDLGRAAHPAPAGETA
jgi:hypothetical protein